MIKRLDWDSDFFGYAVGEIELKNSNQQYLIESLKEAEGFKLIYVISDEELNFNAKELELVDIKTRLRKTNIAEATSVCENVGEYRGGEDEQLQKLALQSGVFSRFKVDKHFNNGEFKKLYLKWIEDSINKSIADKVIIYEEHGQNCFGFVTLKFKNYFSEIGLIAVDENSRGKGIAKKLLNYADQSTLLHGLEQIEVVTQYKNVPAMKLYEKAGYQIVSKKYIYHLWN